MAVSGVFEHGGSSLPRRLNFVHQLGGDLYDVVVL